MAVEENLSNVRFGNDEFDESSLVDKLDKREMDDINIAHKESSLGTRAGDGVEIQNDTKVENSVEEKNNHNQNKRRNKHTRRGSKKNKPRKPRQKFKPYNTLTWDEKRKLGERDTVKAVRRRKELVLQKGRPIAPYNTTQFLMEEHNVLDNFESTIITQSATKPGYTSSDNMENGENGDSSSTSISDDEYFDKDFNDFYEKVHIDTLNSYSKEDLIKTVYELENKIETLEKNAKNVDTGLLEENTRLTNEIKELKRKIERPS